MARAVSCTRWGIARRDGGVVGVRQGAMLGVSFHPELTGERLFHAALLRAGSGRVPA